MRYNNACEQKTDSTATCILHCGWLQKYSKVKHELRKRFLVLSNMTKNGDKKKISTYKTEYDAFEEKNATEIIEMNDVYNVMEYFGSLNKINDNKHFIVNDKFVFKCNNWKQRALWIAKIMKTETLSSQLSMQHQNDQTEKEETQYSVQHFNTFDQLIHTHQTIIRQKCIENHISVPIVIESTSNKHILLNITCSQLNLNNMKQFETFIKTVVDDIKYPLTGHINIYIKDNNGIPIDTSCNGAFYTNVIDKCINVGYYVYVKPWYKYNRWFKFPQEMKDDSNATTGDYGVCEKGLNCSIYLSMKNDYNYTKDNLNHLQKYNHFNNNISYKTICRYGDKCKSYLRMLKNENQRHDDECHFEIYRHPPRNDRQIKMTNDANNFIVIGNGKNVHVESECESSDPMKDFLFEVIENGFKSDLCLTKWDEWNDLYSILKIVNKKMDSIKHKQCYQSCLTRCNMLSLILYTGCDCNYDLCKSQRNGNYKKWKCFDWHLGWAITKLSNGEHLHGVSLYSGLRNVCSDKNELTGCYFPTYISTSWNKKVSLHFMKKNGMLIEINDDKFINNIQCCSVDWISKFTDECEVLIARSDIRNTVKFDLKIMDQQTNNKHGKICRQKRMKQTMKLSLNNEQQNNQQQQTELIEQDLIDLLTFLLSTKFDEISIQINQTLFPQCDSIYNNFSLNKYQQFKQSKTMKLIQRHGLLKEFQNKIETTQQKLNHGDFHRFLNCVAFKRMACLLVQNTMKLPSLKRMNDNENKIVGIVEATCKDLNGFFVGCA